LPTIVIYQDNHIISRSITIKPGLSEGGGANIDSICIRDTLPDRSSFTGTKRTVVIESFLGGVFDSRLSDKTKILLKASIEPNSQDKIGLERAEESSFAKNWLENIEIDSVSLFKWVSNLNR